MFSGKEIKALRRQKQLTQEDLAMMVGVSRTTIYQWESGKYYPEGQNLIKLAQVLGVTVDSLLPKAPELSDGASGENTENKIPLWRAEQELSKEAGVTVNLKASMDVFKKELDTKDIEKIKEMIKALRDSGEKGHIGLNIDLTEATDDDLL